MTIQSSKDGKVFVGGVEVARVVGWMLRETSRAKAYSANDTGGARRRVPGVRDSAGRFDVMAADYGRAPVAEGDLVDLHLHADASGENYYELSAVIGAVEVEVDVSEGKPIAYAVAFSGAGPVVAHGNLAPG